MSSLFISDSSLRSISWQGLERVVCRLLQAESYLGVRLVGQTSDQGADVIAHKNGKRWLFQIKRWKNKAGVGVLDETLVALQLYRANIPVIVALNGFDDNAREHQRVLHSRGILIQFWDRSDLLRRVARLEDKAVGVKTPRDYQEQAIQVTFKAWQDKLRRRAMIVMATGLGKTFTAAEIVRRIDAYQPVRVLVLAHTNEIVYQLERSFWPFMAPSRETLVWNGHEQPSQQDLERVPFLFACLNSVASHLERGFELPVFDLILIDECHHVGGSMYKTIISRTRAGESDGPFLLGLTATPWRPDETDLTDYFGEPLFTMDMVSGLRMGFLSNVDYRMFTDNIDWGALSALEGNRFSPRQINKTLFISEWDSAVIRELQRVWKEQPNARAIVFCGTIDHAVTMRDQINALGFCNAAAIFSQTQGGHSMQAWERNRLLSDFQEGIVQLICAIDVFNEGVDIPDVNVIVFQRVTHSRRIFIQQLGRGLRLAEGKQKVIVLDFVSDIRRFAAGINLKNEMSAENVDQSGKPIRIRLQHSVSFCRAGDADPESERFLREWLEDVATIEEAGEDASVLKFPPFLPNCKS
jgi:superfamily II DNA or RNA helicase